MNKIYDIITEKILVKLEQGIIPWKRTWTSQFPRNFVNDYPYRGINILLLGLQEFESHYWLSFKQCKDLGGSVKKDEHATMVVFWKPLIRISENELDEVNADLSFMLRYYYVFNVQQCNLPNEALNKRKLISSNPKLLESEQVIQQYPKPPAIVHNNFIPNPRYLPRIDRVEIQSINNFNTSDDYYASLYHELAHSTGSKERLNRKGIVDKIEFGTENYTKEELIAEISASFLCSYTGIEKTFSNQISYIQNWLTALSNDKRMIIIAASQAQKATEYILNFSSTNLQEE